MSDPGDNLGSGLPGVVSFDFPDSLNIRQIQRAPGLLADHPYRTHSLTEVYAPRGEPTVDIIFVHGLTGRAHTAWTSKCGCFWPLELLSKTVASVHPRILTCGYVNTIGDNIARHAKDLAESIAAERKVSYLNFICSYT